MIIYSYKASDYGFNLTILASEVIPIHIECIYMLGNLASYPICRQVPFEVRPCNYSRRQFFWLGMCLYLLELYLQKVVVAQGPKARPQLEVLDVLSVALLPISINIPRVGFN